MARTAGTSARTQRLIAVAATCLLGAVTAFAIGRVFQGHAATYRLLAAALASALLACALERRNLLAATAVSAAALLVAIGILIFPATTWHGLPTVDTLHAIGRAAGLVGQQARIQVAPSIPLAPLMLAALTATWAAVFSSHALAFRAGSPLLALLPPVALVAFADTVLDQFVKPLYGVAFLAAALLVIFADGLRRLQGWGPVWTGPGRDAQLTRTAGRGARRLAFACLAIALIAPALMPGFGSKGFLDFSTNGSGSVSLDPLVNIASDLSSTQDLPVFTVETKYPTYYRSVALTNFDGSRWTPDPNADTREVSQGDLSAPTEIDPTTLNALQGATYDFKADNLILGPYLPLPYPATNLTLNQPLAFDASGSSIGLPEPVGPGTSYRAYAKVIDPTPEQLRQASAVLPTPDPADVALPLDTREKIEPIAKSWVGSETNMYDQVMAIERRFQSRFQYDSKIASSDPNLALLEFLTKTKRGFCQQFAGAMAVMLRSLGIPARDATGYTAGQPTGEGTYQVTQHDAHAWVEVRFPTYGWLTFDPTPGASDQTFTDYNNPNGAPACKGRGCVPTDPNTPLPTPTVKPPSHQQTPPEVLLGAGTSPAQPPSARTFTVRHGVLAGVLLGLLVLLLIPLVRAWRRRRRLRRAAGEPRQLILATYDVFTERAAELGFPRGPGETLEEYRRRVAGSGRLSDGHLDRLTRIASRAAYAAEQPDEEDSLEAGAAAATTLKELQRTAPWQQRILGRYRSER